MNRISILLIVFSFSFNVLHAQESLNDYKYVIVPNTYDFLSEADRFQLNSLTKFLFNKYGFTAYMADESLPKDLQNNTCLGLRADVQKGRGGLLSTKLFVNLKNCNNAEVFKTKIGESRVKEFKTSYNLALRDAFTSFKAVNYAYNGSKSELLSTQVESSKPTTEVIKEKAVPKEIKTSAPAPEVKQVEPEKHSAPNTQETITPIVEKVVKQVQVEKTVLYAQSIAGGFQIVDNTPKVVYKIAYSGIKDVFIVLGRDAIIHKVNNVWTYSEIEEGSLKAKTLNIKF